MIENEITNIIDEKFKAEQHKNLAINQIDSMLSHFIENEDFKKVHLLSYWFGDYTKYIIDENEFSPNSLKKYKRGSIIKANLGFNIGSEEGRFTLLYCNRQT